MKKTSHYPGAILLFMAICACNEAEQKAQEAPALETKSLAALKISGAISCTKGLTVRDSTLFMQGGGDLFKPTVEDSSQRPTLLEKNMSWIPGGEFSMGGVNPVGMQDGGKENMNDARPVHRVRLTGFWMDENEVTNEEFTAFVKATGYVTVAEKKPTKEEFPEAPEENLVAGSVVFSPPANPVPLDNYFHWWSYIKGADWRHPAGPGSSIAGKEKFPVVQVAWEDAMAYAKWAGKRLPTEAEWEFAARAGKTGNLYSWGNELKPEGKWMTNVFQGSFPNHDEGGDGYIGIAPVKQFKPNDYGLYDIAGNVWEWCSDWYRHDYYEKLSRQGVAVNPKGPDDSFDPTEPGQPKKIQRGGSYLCTDQYCTRYMVGTRGKGEWRSASNHIGFRCVKDVFPERKIAGK